MDAASPRLLFLLNFPNLRILTQISQITRQDKKDGTKKVFPRQVSFIKHPFSGGLKPTTEGGLKPAIEWRLKPAIEGGIVLSPAYLCFCPCG